MLLSVDFKVYIRIVNDDNKYYHEINQKNGYLGPYLKQKKKHCLRKQSN